MNLLRTALLIAGVVLAFSLSAQGTLTVTYLDVGQADAILVQQDGHNLLIDAGNNADQKVLLAQLDARGVQTLEAVIGTHAHEDHIGSMDAVIRTREVEKVYFPHQTASTKTFQDFVGAVRAKGLRLTVPHPGDQFDLGQARLEVLAPARDDYDDANDFSIVVRLTFGTITFLFTGDANFHSEAEMLASGVELSATVLKVGHHGSRTSTGTEFLSKVQPRYAVISVGADNKYGHPTTELLSRLQASGAKVFRTDLQGTVVATSDGSVVTFTTER